MAKPKTSDVRSALVSTLAQITIANGYSRTLDASHIYPVYTPEFSANVKDEAYPKVFVVIDNAKSENLVAYQQEITLGFIIILVLKGNKATGMVIDDANTSLQDAMADFIDDVDTCLGRNMSLNSSVDTCNLSEWTTDCGFSFPETVALLRVTTTRKVQKI